MSKFLQWCLLAFAAAFIDVTLREAAMRHGWLNGLAFGIVMSIGKYMGRNGL